MNRLLIFSILFFIFLPTNSQGDTLLITIDEAVKRALENNPEIIVSRYDSDIAKNEATAGNAGLLPTLSISGGYTEELNNAYLEFASPQQEPIDRSGARSTSYNAAVQLNYNIFGGLEKYNRYENLMIQSDIRDTQTRLTVESTISQVFNVYLETARLFEQAVINREAMEISYDRFVRVENRYDYGGATQLQVLNARVDLNQDSITLARTLTDLSNSKRSLMVLMGDSPDTDFTVETEFEMETQVDSGFVMNQALNNNVNLVLAQFQKENAEINSAIARAGRYPDIDLSASYGYSRVENEAGFIELQENLGLTGSINLRYTIFGGFQSRTRINNAEISLNRSEKNLEHARNQVKRDVLNALANYKNSLYLLSLSDDDLKTARLNFERSKEAFQNGQINSTDFRQAQLNLIRTAFRISELEVRAKLAEVELFRLAGILLENN
jgi:outer membrane protein TolC